MKRIAPLLFFAVASMLLWAEAPVIAVGDFVVQSRNPSHEFLGKGLSRLVAGELRRSGAVRLTERENLQKILQEQEFSLSDLADRQKQVKIGAMLSARYLVMGEVIDMAGVILLSLRMVDVETGQIVWQDELQEKLATYDYMGAYFANSLLKSMNASPGESTLAKLGKKEEKREAAIVSLSEGIDALDRGNQAKAREDLKKARNLDPVNEVVKEFLSKLESVSPKFRVENELYSSSYNPASLGFLQNDLLSVWGSFVANPPGATIHPDRIEDQLTGDYWASNFGRTLKIGYAVPLVDRVGVMAEFIFGGYRWLAEREDGTKFSYGAELLDFVKDSFNNFGGAVSLGVALSRNVSVGGTLMLWDTIKGPGDLITVDPGVYWAAGGGVMLKALEDSLTCDTSFMYTSQGMYYADDMQVLTGDMPLLAEVSLTYELLDQLLFVGLKGIANIYTDDRGGYFLRVIPVVEYRLLDFVSVRAGYEYSQIDQTDFAVGHGFMAGLTVSVRKIDLSTNVTYGRVPARLLPGETMEILTFLMGATWSPGLVAR